MAVTAGALGALGAGAFGYLLRRPLPRVDGELRVAGLNAAIEVVRDRRGIPHITARDEWDAFYGQGFCHAQDRLWQMELNRRLSRGELSEAVGPATLEVDRFVRRLGLRRVAECELALLDADTRQVLEAYARGASAAIEGMLRDGRLPLEFQVLGFQPRAWEPLDTLTFGRYFGFALSPNWASELVRSHLIARLGPGAAAALEPDVWQVGSDALPRLPDWGGAEWFAPSAADLPLDPGAPQGGSNAWVVNGDRSSTGKPLLAADPHLQPGLPGVWYEAHLVGGAGLNVIGATLPGVPGVSIGHNRDIAWGFTVSYADGQDFFIERVDPGDPRRVEFQGRWESGTLHREAIAVKGRSQPWVEEVLVTPRHGPLVTPTPALPAEHRTLALKSTALEAPQMASALVRLNRARDWDEFREACSRWTSASFDTVYADVAGNIGHQMVGLVPVRARGEGLVPSPGWTGQYEWTGYVPFDELPRIFNPSDGLWATANHNLAKDSRHFFTREWQNPTRYHRIRQVLESKARHSAIDFGALQADELSVTSLEIARLLAAHLRPRTEMERRALEYLRGWDGRVSADSVPPSIVQAFFLEWVRVCHAESVGDLLPLLYGVGPHPILAGISSLYTAGIPRMLVRLRAWADAGAPGHREARAFAEALQLLRQRLGSDIRRWQWGRLHQLKLKHALSVQKPLGLLFDLPACPSGGDLETVRVAGPPPGTLDAGNVAPSYRLIADLSDWDQTLSIIPAGQSGQRGSPHYADQLHDWRRGAYHPLPFTRPAIARRARHTLRLIPR